MNRALDETVRPRGRPPKSPAEVDEMRELIVMTAQRLFQEEGYSKVSVRRLAKEVGCSPMTLYKYFDGKIAILQTLWAVVFRELFGEMNMLLEDESNPKARLRIACKHYVEFWLQHPEHYRLVFMAEGVTQTEVSLFVDDPETIGGFNLFLNVIGAALTATDDKDLKVGPDLIMCALHGVAHNKITISGYDWTDANAMIDRLLDSLLGPTH